MIRLFSNDGPRSTILALILIAIGLALAFAPFLFPGVRALETAARICIFSAGSDIAAKCQGC